MSTQKNLLEESEAMATELVEQKSNLVEHQVEPTPMMLIQTAMESGCEPEKLAQLLEIQKQWNAEQERKEDRAAEKAFNAAMAVCQAEMQAVVATHLNSQTTSKYADHFDIDKVARPIYTKHGFSLTFTTSRSEVDKHIKLTAKVRHQDGHCEIYEDDYPIDDAGLKGTTNKTAIQAKGSSQQYAIRYMTKGIFNIVVRGEDNDGQRAPEVITSDQVAKLNVLMEKIQPVYDPGKNILDSVLTLGDVKSLDQFPAHLFALALSKLQATAKSKGVL